MFHLFFFRFHLHAPWGTEPHVALTLQFNLLSVWATLVVNAELLPLHEPSLCDSVSGPSGKRVAWENLRFVGS